METMKVQSSQDQHIKCKYVRDVLETCGVLHPTAPPGDHLCVELFDRTMLPDIRLHRTDLKRHKHRSALVLLKPGSKAKDIRHRTFPNNCISSQSTVTLAQSLNLSTLCKDETNDQTTSTNRFSPEQDASPPCKEGLSDPSTAGDMRIEEFVAHPVDGDGIKLHIRRTSRSLSTDKTQDESECPTRTKEVLRIQDECRNNLDNVQDDNILSSEVTTKHQSGDTSVSTETSQGIEEFSGNLNSLNTKPVISEQHEEFEFQGDDPEAESGAVDPGEVAEFDVDDLGSPKVECGAGELGEDREENFDVDLSESPEAEFGVNDLGAEFGDGDPGNTELQNTPLDLSTKSHKNLDVDLASEVEKISTDSKDININNICEQQNFTENPKDMGGQVKPSYFTCPSNFESLKEKYPKTSSQVYTVTDVKDKTIHNITAVSDLKNSLPISATNEHIACDFTHVTCVVQEPNDKESDKSNGTNESSQFNIRANCFESDANTEQSLKQIRTSNDEHISDESADILIINRPPSSAHTECSIATETTFIAAKSACASPLDGAEESLVHTPLPPNLDRKQPNRRLAQYERWGEIPVSEMQISQTKSRSPTDDIPGIQLLPASSEMLQTTKSKNIFIKQNAATEHMKQASLKPQHSEFSNASNYPDIIVSHVENSSRSSVPPPKQKIPYLNNAAIDRMDHSMGIPQGFPVLPDISSLSLNKLANAYYPPFKIPAIFQKEFDQTEAIRFAIQNQTYLSTKSQAKMNQVNSNDLTGSAANYNMTTNLVPRLVESVPHLQNVHPFKAAMNDIHPSFLPLSKNKSSNLQENLSVHDSQPVFGNLNSPTAELYRTLTLDGNVIKIPVVSDDLMPAGVTAHTGLRRGRISARGRRNTPYGSRKVNKQNNLGSDWKVNAGHPGSIVQNKRCDACGKMALFVCDGCQSALYCSPRCQLKTWWLHKDICAKKR